MERIAPHLRRRVVDLEAGDPEPDAFADVEIAYFSGDLFPDDVRPFARALRQAKPLRWLHTFSAGVDDPFFQRLLETGVRISTSSGAQAVPIAQTVMMYLLALSRDLPGWLADQSARRWNPRAIGDLQGRRLLVLGLGPIGQEVARLGLAFGMDVVGLRRSPRGDEPCTTRPLAELAEQLPEADAVVLALPLSEETRGILGRDEIARMKTSAVVANVGRGDLVDEPALVDALRGGRLAGAGLDVFAVEPLPEESPLWSLPNVIVTPHSSGTSAGNRLRADAIFLENLERYLAGRPLRNEATAPDTSENGAAGVR
jgi:phosphoglycerate dehydrogenase-like enzyme